MRRHRTVNAPPAPRGLISPPITHQLWMAFPAERADHRRRSPASSPSNWRSLRKSRRWRMIDLEAIATAQGASSRSCARVGIDTGPAPRPTGCDHRSPPRPTGDRLRPPVHPQQVLEHRESGDLQYDLADRAVALGWPADRVIVIDEDQGRSGKTARTGGFQRLLAEVGLDHVGLILGIEMSRLARSCGTGINSSSCVPSSTRCWPTRTALYDPTRPQRPAPAGALKGTMSEAELHYPPGPDAGRAAEQGPPRRAVQPRPDRLRPGSRAAG